MGFSIESFVFRFRFTVDIFKVRVGSFSDYPRYYIGRVGLYGTCTCSEGRPYSNKRQSSWVSRVYYGLYLHKVSAF
jgi:hypothetical protein